MPELLTIHSKWKQMDMVTIDCRPSTEFLRRNKDKISVTKQADF